jgi:hypothetical protein
MTHRLFKFGQMIAMTITCALPSAPCSMVPHTIFLGCCSTSMAPTELAEVGKQRPSQGHRLSLVVRRPPCLPKPCTRHTGPRRASQKRAEYLFALQKLSQRSGFHPGRPLGHLTSLCWRLERPGLHPEGLTTCEYVLSTPVASSST